MRNDFLSMKEKIIVLIFLSCLSFAFTQKSNTLPYKILSIDKERTSSNLFELGIITLLPLLTLVQVNRTGEYQNEIIISASIFTVPVLISWPLFLFELSQGKKIKK